jgi:hypothetical protein
MIVSVYILWRPVAVASGLAAGGDGDFVVDLSGKITHLTRKSRVDGIRKWRIKEVEKLGPRRLCGGIYDLCTRVVDGLLSLIVVII